MQPSERELRESLALIAGTFPEELAACQLLPECGQVQVVLILNPELVVALALLADLIERGRL